MKIKYQSQKQGTGEFRWPDMDLRKGDTVRLIGEEMLVVSVVHEDGEMIVHIGGKQWDV